jgi:hypothetical protein
MISLNSDIRRGYLLYAHNNHSLDYACLAICNALLIKKNLIKANNVALVTDHGTLDWMQSKYGQDLLDRAFEHVIINDQYPAQSGTRRFRDTNYTTFTDRYHNTDRTTAYDLSPFEETVLLDVDYLMLDDSMDLVWGTHDEFLCNTKTLDLDHRANDFGFDNRFNDMSIPLYWATAIYFRRSEKAQLIFELMDFVREHYAYYQYLYRFSDSGFYRNDYAISIAIHMANNLMEYGNVPSLPIDTMLISTECDEIHAFKDGSLYITSEQESGDFRLHSIDSNLHIMNKRAILRMSQEIIAYASR